jgi:hypothetical protein
MENRKSENNFLLIIILILLLRMTVYKKVKFDLEKNVVYYTYSPDEYDRHIIDCVLYMRGYNKVSNEEWNNIFVELNLYKMKEMKVHKDSIQNLKLT